MQLDDTILELLRDWKEGNIDAMFVDAREINSILFKLKHGKIKKWF